MHILLTDILTCPRCGPDFGLILLADVIADRRVTTGRLGCANCRESYRVKERVADLRTGTGEGWEMELAPPFDGDPEEAAVRVTALLGVTEGPAMIVLAGPAAGLSTRIGGMIPDVEPVSLVVTELPEEERSGSILRVEGVFPFYPRSVRAVALPFRAGDAQIAAAARVVAPGGRLLVCTEDGDAGAVLDREGLSVILDQEGVLVAERPASDGSARALHQLGGSPR